MVEAGANEIPEAEILDALDIAHGEIRKLVAAQRELRREGRQGQARGRGPAGRRGALRADRRARTARRSTRRPRWRTSSRARTPRRPSRRRCSRSTPATRAPTTYAEYRARRAARVRQAREDDHPRAHRRPEEAPGRPRPDEIRADLDRGRPAAARRTARRCSRAARRRRSRSSRSAPRARRCGWTPSGWRRPSATSTTTTSRRSRWARPASCAAPSAATSATARSPSARWSR